MISQKSSAVIRQIDKRRQDISPLLKMKHLSLEKRYKLHRQKFTAKQRKMLIAKARQEEISLEKQQSLLKSEWRQATQTETRNHMIADEKERHRRAQKKEKWEKMLKKKKLEDQQRKLVLQQYNEQIRRKDAKTREHYNKRNLQMKQWIRRGGGQYIKPENAKEYFRQQASRERSKKKVRITSEQQQKALIEGRRRQMLESRQAQEQLVEKQQKEMRKINLKQKANFEHRQKQFIKSRELHQRRARRETKFKIAERLKRIKYHTEHADEWQAPTPERETLQRIRNTVYDDKAMSIFVRMRQTDRPLATTVKSSIHVKSSSKFLPSVSTTISTYDLEHKQSAATYVLHPQILICLQLLMGSKLKRQFKAFEQAKYEFESDAMFDAETKIRLLFKRRREIIDHKLRRDFITVLRSGHRDQIRALLGNPTSNLLNDQNGTLRSLLGSSCLAWIINELPTKLNGWKFKKCAHSKSNNSALIFLEELFRNSHFNLQGTFIQTAPLEQSQPESTVKNSNGSSIDEGRNTGLSVKVEGSALVQSSAEFKRRRLEKQYAERHSRVINNEISVLLSRLNELRLSQKHQERCGINTNAVILQQQELQRSLTGFRQKKRDLLASSNISTQKLKQAEVQMAKQMRKLEAVEKATRHGGSMNKNMDTTSAVDSAKLIQQPPQLLFLRDDFKCPSAEYKDGRELKSGARDVVRVEQILFQCLIQMGRVQPPVNNALNSTSNKNPWKQAAKNDIPSYTESNQKICMNRDHFTSCSSTTHMDATHAFEGRSSAEHLALLLFRRHDFSLFYIEEIPTSSALELAQAANKLAQEKRSRVNKMVRFGHIIGRLSRGKQSSKRLTKSESPDQVLMGNGKQNVKQGADDNSKNEYSGFIECNDDSAVVHLASRSRSRSLQRTSTAAKLESVMQGENVQLANRRLSILEDRNAAAIACQKSAFEWIMQLDSEMVALAFFQRPEALLSLEVHCPPSLLDMDTEMEILQHVQSSKSTISTTMGKDRGEDGKQQQQSTMVIGTVGSPLHTSPATTALPAMRTTCTPLKWALARGFDELRNLLLLSQERLPKVDHHGRTALMHAARLGLQDVAKKLLEDTVAPINARDKLSGEHKTAFMYALETASAAVKKNSHALRARCISIAGAIARHRLFDFRVTDARDRTSAMYVAKSNHFKQLLQHLLQLRDEHDERAEQQNEPYDTTFFATDAYSSSVLTHAVMAGADVCARDLVAYLVRKREHVMAKKAQKEAEAAKLQRQTSNNIPDFTIDSPINAAKSTARQDVSKSVDIMTNNAEKNSKQSLPEDQELSLSNSTNPSRMPVIIAMQKDDLDQFVPPELMESLAHLNKLVHSLNNPEQGLVILDTLVRCHFTHDKVFRIVQQIGNTVFSNKDCVSLLILEERRKPDQPKQQSHHQRSQKEKKAQPKFKRQKQKSHTSSPSSRHTDVRNSGTNQNMWSRLVLGALGMCSITANRLTQGSPKARNMLSGLHKAFAKQLHRHRVGRSNVGTPNRNDSSLSQQAACPTMQYPSLRVKSSSIKVGGLGLDLITAPALNHQLARQDDIDLNLIPGTSGFSFGENGYIFLLVFMSMAQNQNAHNEIKELLQKASIQAVEAFRQNLDPQIQHSGSTSDENVRLEQKSTKESGLHATEANVTTNDAACADIDTDILPQVRHLLSSEYDAAPCKTFHRMRHLLGTRHKPLKRPRPAHNLDVIRGTAIFRSIEGLQAGFRLLSKHLPAIVAIRNEFGDGSNNASSASSGRTFSRPSSPLVLGEIDQRTLLGPDDECLTFVDKEDGLLRNSGYRAVKINYVFDAKETYREMAKRCEKMWKEFVICLPDGVQKDACSVLAFLFSDKVANESVRLICELHLTLDAFARLLMVNDLCHRTIKCAVQGVATMGQMLHSSPIFDTVEGKESFLMRQPIINAPSAHIKGTRTLPTEQLDYDVAITELPRIPKPGRRVKMRDKNAKPPKQQFFISLDVNNSGALERDEFLHFVAMWYSLPDVLGPDYEEDYETEDEKQIDIHSKDGTCINAEPHHGASVFEKLHTQQSGKSSKKVRVIKNCGTDISGKISALVEADSDAEEAATFAAKQEKEEAEATRRDQQRKNQEKFDMQDKFIKSYLEDMDTTIPLHLVTFLQILRKGTPDDAEKARVRDIWETLVRAKEARERKFLQEKQRAEAEAARRALFATV